MQNKKFKKTLLIDLDGVLNTYTGNYQEDFIPPVKDGAIEFISDLSDEYIIKLFTTREKYLAQQWLRENKLDSFIEDVTNIKEMSYIYIDDRCIKFEGDYIELKRKIKNFKVWYKNLK